MNKRYNEQDPAPQYDPETARIRRALRAQKARRRKKMRSRRLFLLGMALILLFVLVPNLWGRAERLLYPRKYEALVDQWAETYGLDPLLVDAFIRTESGFDPQATSTVDARGLMQMTEETFIWLRSKIAPDEGCSLQISTTRRPASGSDAITCTCAWSATTAMLPLPLLLITAGGAR